jgi:hypothetical protein
MSMSLNDVLSVMRTKTAPHGVGISSRILSQGDRFRKALRFISLLLSIVILSGQLPGAARALVQQPRGQPVAVGADFLPVGLGGMGSAGRLSAQAAIASVIISTTVPARAPTEQSTLIVTTLTGFDSNTAKYTYQWFRSAVQSPSNYQPSQDTDPATPPSRYNLILNGPNDVGHRFYLQVTDALSTTARSNVIAIGPEAIPDLTLGTLGAGHPRANEEIRVNRPFFNLKNASHDIHNPPNGPGTYVYDFQIATTSTFSPITSLVVTGTNVLETTTNNDVTYWQSTAVLTALSYYWRARAKVADAPGNWSDPVAFSINNVWSSDGETWHWPLDNANVGLSGSFKEGYYHAGYLQTQLHGGIDVAVCGDAVRASRSGILERATGASGTVGLRHPRALRETLYLHMSPITNLRRGTYINQGTEVGKADSTPAGTPCHLHFDVANIGRTAYYNPLSYVLWNDTQVPTVTLTYLRTDRFLNAKSDGIVGTTYIIARTYDPRGISNLAPYSVRFFVNGDEQRNIQFDTLTAGDNETGYYAYESPTTLRKKIQPTCSTTNGTL